MPGSDTYFDAERASALGNARLAPTTRRVRVRTIGRFDASVAPGGGEVQMHATAEALHAGGIDARPWRPWDDCAQAGDVWHFFGSRPEFLPLLEQARRSGGRIALSTIAWFDWRNTLREPGPLHRRLLACGRHALRRLAPGMPSWRRRIYHAADVLLPNSQAEAEQLMRLFQVPAAKIRVVPNGADERFAAADPMPFRRQFDDAPFVLCPGRIEPRKNQLALIHALRGTGLRLVILGDTVPEHERYADACRRAADDKVHFLGRIDRADPLLASAYAAASAVALVGWYETPGLAALEAALTGTPVVLPIGGCAHEYFGPLARYVPPNDGRAIRDAVCAAAASPRSPELVDLVRSRFTWRHVAAETLLAYDAIA